MNEIVTVFGVSTIGLLLHATWRLATISAKLDSLVSKSKDHEKRIKKMESHHA